VTAELRRCRHKRSPLSVLESPEVWSSEVATLLLGFACVDPFCAFYRVKIGGHRGRDLMAWVRVVMRWGSIDSICSIVDLGLFPAC
jgi:hypothetical protein